MQEQNETFELDMIKQPDELVNFDEHKLKLRKSPEVSNLLKKIDMTNTESVLNFGAEPSIEISQAADKILATMQRVRLDKASEMLEQLTKIMDQVDLDEITSPKIETNLLKKIFKRVQNKLEDLFAKYNSIGAEIQKVHTILMGYNRDILKINVDLKTMYDANFNNLMALEKYVVAGEMGLEQIDDYLTNIHVTLPNENERMVKEAEIREIREVLDKRIHDLRIAEAVAMQAAPMIMNSQRSNNNLQLSISSSFITTMPLFKQGIINAIQNQQQEVIANGMDAVNNATAELLKRNAVNNARTGVRIQELAGRSAISVDDIKTSYETIVNGINEANAIRTQIAEERKTEATQLEQMKQDIKKSGLLIGTLK